jgi:8-oxo-dGTP pyrophosphatase MutT (NUDIX family)
VGNDLILSPSVAAVIHNQDGKLLLQEKSSGEAWSLPAGRIELGESPQEAIISEVMEETGYAVRIHAIVGVFGGQRFRYTYPSGDRVEYVVTLFSAKSSMDPEFLSTQKQNSQNILEGKTCRSWHYRIR